MLGVCDRRRREESRATAATRRTGGDGGAARAGADCGRPRGARHHPQRRAGEAARRTGQTRHGTPEPHEFQRLRRKPVSGPTPILDFFKRGEVARDVRLLAAQGMLAPRANEQLEILVLLLDDPDAEVRETAGQTLGRIPREVLEAFLGRSDVPIGLREFFGDRGVFPAQIPQITVPEDEPLIDAASADSLEPADEAGEARETGSQTLAQTGFSDRRSAWLRSTWEG